MKTGKYFQYVFSKTPIPSGFLLFKQFLNLLLTYDILIITERSFNIKRKRGIHMIKKILKNEQELRHLVWPYY